MSTLIIYLLAYENGTVCSETSAYKIQTPGKYPEENVQQMSTRRTKRRINAQTLIDQAQVHVTSRSKRSMKALHFLRPEIMLCWQRTV